jgi:hypothetical protein
VAFTEYIEKNHQEADMYKKLAWFYLLQFIFLLPADCWSQSAPVISISGAVKQSISVPLEKLNTFNQVNVRLNEVTQDKEFHGGFFYRGVPLRTLLELADIQKKDTDFSKAIDLAIVIRNITGLQTVVSWGEIFYRNPSEIIIATSAEPIMPHKSCQSCHQPEVYEPWLKQMKRQVGFPKLIVANDFYSDRSLENILSIEVTDMRPVIEAQKMNDLYSPSFVVTGLVKQELSITDLSPYTHTEIVVKQMGDGKGYHGLKNFGGVSLLSLLNKAGIYPDTSTVFLISAPDGYRSLLSYGELALTPRGKDIIIADTAAGEPLRKNGKFILIMPDDLSADRWVKAVSKIEVITFGPRSKE